MCVRPPREQLGLQHHLVPLLMSQWKLEDALDAARTKLQLITENSPEFLLTVPSALLEIYEICSVAKVLFAVILSRPNFFWLIIHIYYVFRQNVIDEFKGSRPSRP